MYDVGKLGRMERSAAHSVCSDRMITYIQTRASMAENKQCKTPFKCQNRNCLSGLKCAATLQVVGANPEAYASPEFPGITDHKLPTNSAGFMH
jgi:hypothetical protein